MLRKKTPVSDFRSERSAGPECIKAATAPVRKPPYRQVRVPPEARHCKAAEANQPNGMHESHNREHLPASAPRPSANGTTEETKEWADGTTAESSRKNRKCKKSLKIHNERSDASGACTVGHTGGKCGTEATANRTTPAQTNTKGKHHTDANANERYGRKHSQMTQENNTDERRNNNVRAVH